MSSQEGLLYLYIMFQYYHKYEYFIASDREFHHLKNIC